MPGVIQRLLAAAALLVLGPLILALGLAVRLTSPGPALHRAVRVRPGGTFTLYKLRTMRAGAATAGPGITAGGDPRVTPLGRLLRRTKMDELPQLWNVVRGDMLLVGPRPEDPRYVDPADPLHALVFGAKPGITGAASVAFRNEESILADAALEVARADGRRATTAADLDRAYRATVLPQKLEIEAKYLTHRSTRGDLALLRETVITSHPGQANEAAPPASPESLAYFVEWGGGPWERLVGQALVSIGDLDGKRVLEIGSRSGRMASLFAMRGASVVGIDIEGGFEAGATAEAWSHGVADRVEFRLDDGRLASVAGDRFDVVFSKSVLVVVPDRGAYLRAVRDVLTPGGTLVVIENGRGGLLAETLRRARRIGWDHRTIDYFDGEAIRELGQILAVRQVLWHRLPPICLVVANKP